MTGRLVSLRWRGFERPSEFLGEIVTGLARASLTLWPDWPACDEASEAFREVAARYCASGQLPLPNHYPLATLARELTLTMGGNLAVLLVVEQDLPIDAGVIARDAAGWLATNTGAAVAVLATRASGAELSRWVPVVDLTRTASSFE
ncbi:MAG: hypothetical protein SFV51_00890 [Bryobacteraceae bacterium]|nr:hypothetical protein [Bryobacteraceae bacterium]